MAIRFVGIDPGTNSGFVALDLQGNVLAAQELKPTGKTVKGGLSTPQLVELENQLYQHLKGNDRVCIEAVPFGTMSQVTTGMIHGGLRSMIHRKKLDFDLVNPMWTKKFVDVKVEKGQTDKQKKDAMREAVLEKFGFSHKSHNVVDAYVIARISLNLHLMRQYEPLIDQHRIQQEVVSDIMHKAAE
ncbi:hypothetical protein [Paenibacillus methanolicus]|uniref:Crossover junction endodeoxyribonuclease RuvC n=1 Tax=Paenibacillus methanolicus TaxID=582686 RepID=A0A5S5BPM4_9BACL|nr:hypothetical protein [Paenibacillus methanolicus]TYP68904.1 crossover junction endodeoxyribonuclease RuvC [Paenibacillus methanolicus]